MKKRLLIIFALLCIGRLLGAAPFYQKEAFLIGGGCDTINGGANFIVEFNEWSHFLEEKGWHVQGFIDPSKQPQLNNVVEADWSAFKDTLKNLAYNRAPQQLLIGMISHGNYKQGKHGICINNTYEPIRELYPILKELTDEGVQIAVIDMSCFSAYTAIELKDAVSCVVSMAGPEEGTGVISEAVAKNLHTLPFLGENPSLEDVWFSVLEHSNKKLRQIPQITGLPVFYTQEVEKKARTDAKDNYISVLNANILEKVFSEDTIQGIETYFVDKIFWAKQCGILGVMYLNKLPNRQERPCANFYF